jgi:hypothetical protein
MNCRDCRYWSYDMDMEPFCLHPNANAIGTDVNAMRGTVKTRHMRGEPCGPDAKFFVSKQPLPQSA